MKTKILLMLLFVSSFAFAQLPTDEIGRYLFTSGSLVNDVTPGTEDFSRTGSTGANSNDRFLTSNNAQLLSGDYLTRGNYNATNSSLSFWVKSTTNDAVKRTILDKSFRSGNGFGGSETGFFIYMQNGKIGIDGSYIQNNAPGGAATQNFFAYSNSTTINNGNWNHVVVTISRSYPQVINSANPIYNLTYNFKIYINGVAQTFQKTNQNSFAENNRVNVNQDLTVANKASGPQFTNANVYLDEVDDIYVYERVLTTTEVVALRDIGGFCIPPTTTEFSVTNINSGQATVLLPTGSSATYEAAIVESGMPFNTAVITSNLFGTNGVVLNLSANKTYELYLREYCPAGVWSIWSDFITFSTPTSIVYVDPGASGTNDGSSWTNAYTSLNTALATVASLSEVWVKGGIYNPDVFDTTISFTIAVNDVSVYGGFVGTETGLSQRVLGVTPTILSGDLFANDDAVLSFGNTTRSDNSANVLKITSDNVVIDGFTVSGGETSGTGAGIIKNVEADGFIMRNMIVENNVARNHSAGLRCEMNRSGNVYIENSIFRNNLSTYYAGAHFYFAKSSSTGGSVYIYNTLFDGNKIEDAPGRQGATGPALGFTGNNFGNLHMRLRNCTIVNNTDSGTLGGTTRGVIAGFRPSTNPGGAFLHVSNSIIWNNRRNTSVLNEQGKSNQFGSSSNGVFNSIGEANFPGFTKTNTLNSDPLFVNSAIGDYTLQPNSPAIDAGDNARVGNDILTDLAGNRRIIGTTVDMGAYELTRNCNELFDYEFTSVSGSPTTAILSWSHPFNPSGPFDLVYVETGQPMASGTTVNNLSTQSYTINNLTPGFYDVYIRAYCNGTPGAYIMLTVGFKTPWFVNVNATGTNTGKNWTNAFATIDEALAVAQTGDKIWIAAGTYKPASGSRSNTINFNIDNLEVYGGFVGTETELSQRNYFSNETILSGDVNGNDTGLSFTAAGRTENNYHVTTIEGNDVVFDGLVISDGQANATSGDDSSGGGIFIGANALNFVVHNSVFRNNVAIGGAGMRSRPVTDNTLTVGNSQFYDNMANYAAGVYLINGGGITHSVEISNSLFYNNESRNHTGADGFTGSSLWLRASSASSTLNSNITNCTFTNNTDLGTRVNTQRGTVSLSRNAAATHNTAVSNNIFFNNTGAGGASTPALTKGHTTFVTAALVSNSIDTDNFSTLPPSFKVNISTADPLFSNASINDYSISSSSPAIDSGDNAYVIGTKDIAGNDRIFNSTVDMGAYEYDATLNIDSFEINNDFKIYPNPTSNILNIKMNTSLKQATIYSVLGAQIMQTKMKTIHTSNLKSGLYLIKIEDENGTVVTKRFIKQ